MQVLNGQHHIVGKGTVAVDDAKHRSVWAMSWNVSLTIETICTVTSSIDLTNDVLPNEMLVLPECCIAIDFSTTPTNS